MLLCKIKNSQEQSYSKHRICEITQEMLQNKTDFHKKSFLKSGSVFGFQGMVWLMWGEPERLSGRPFQPSICSSDFFLNKKLMWQKYPNVFCCTREQAVELFENPQSVNHKTSWSVLDKENFEKQFAQIKQWFDLGEIEKAVPYVFEEGKVEGDQSSFLESMIVCSLKYSSGFLYGSWADGQGCLGLTPEVLIEQRAEREFSTMAVAGTTTLKNFNLNEEEFVSNEKENKEHNWVVDDIKNVLSEFGQVVVGQRQVVKTPSLVHLKTDISLTTSEDLNIENLVESLHPTPALGVFPRNKCMKVMGYLDELNVRGKFGAPFGFSLSKTRSYFVVAIRNIEWSGENVKVGAGCGVVPESQLGKEWAELEHKRESVKQIFGLL